MPIYIAVEVARRELEGRLLLGLVAAERGHDVVLGKLPHGALLAGELDGWRLPPDILHLKSIASSPDIYARFDRLRSQGMRITVQDEEHGLAGPSDFTDFGLQRFPRESLGRVDRLFAWGPVDHGWLVSTYPERTRDILMTGSPRIDLWRPEIIGSAVDVAAVEEHIVVISSTSPFGLNPFWVTLRNARAGLFGPAFEGIDDPAEFAAYDSMSDAYQYVKHIVRALRRLAVRFPDRTVVLRPHHFEDPSAWEALIGELPNVVVRSEGSSRSWVRDAAVVVQGGSTVAIEASVAQRSVVTFVPPGADGRPLRADWSANGIGTIAGSVDDLVEAVDEALREAAPHPAEDSRAFLARRLTALDGTLAADRIVEEWDRMSPPGSGPRVERIGGRRGGVGRMTHALRWTRHAVQGMTASAGRPTTRNTSGKGTYAMEVRHKFPSLDVDALRADAARLSAYLGRFKDVEIVQIGEREVLLRAAGR